MHWQATQMKPSAIFLIFIDTIMGLILTAYVMVEMDCLHRMECKYVKIEIKNFDRLNSTQGFKNRAVQHRVPTDY